MSHQVVAPPRTRERDAFHHFPGYCATLPNGSEKDAGYPAREIHSVAGLGSDVAEDEEVLRVDGVHFVAGDLFADLAVQTDLLRECLREGSVHRRPLRRIVEVAVSDRVLRAILSR